MSVTNPYHPSVLRDRPLGFHWTTPDEEMIRSLDVSFNSKAQLRAVNSMVTEAVLAKAEDQWVSYSRHKSFYSGKQRYYGTSFTYGNVIQAIEDLLHNDLIVDDRALPGGRGRQSRFKATPKLLELWAEAPHAYAPHDVIHLKDANGDLIDYRETDATRRMRREIEALNDYLRSVSIEISGPGVTTTSRHLIVDETFIRRAPPELYRVFGRGRFDCNGRAYGPWQSIPKQRRPDVLLNGEPTSEPDFSQMHPRMLYDQRGIPLIGDAYEVDGFDRSAVKRCLLVLLNAPNRQSATGALMEKLDLDRSQTGRLIDATKQRHAAIGDDMHSDVGIKLMKTESEITLGVLKRCMMAGIPALPIHDSLLTTQSNAGRVTEFMQENYAKHFQGINPCGITVSSPTVPHKGERPSLS